MKHICEGIPKDMVIERVGYQTGYEWIATEWFDGEHITGIIFCPFCGTKLENIDSESI